MMNFKDFLMITEAAEFLGVHKNTLRNWEKAKRIKVYYHPISKYRFYKKEDLEAILNSFKVD